MTDDKLIRFFKDRPLPTGRVKFSDYETADDLQLMVELALERIKSGLNGAAVSREVLIRLHTYLESQETSAGL